MLSLNSFFCQKNVFLPIAQSEIRDTLVSEGAPPKYEPHIKDKLKRERLKELCGEGQTTLHTKVKSE